MKSLIVGNGQIGSALYQIFAPKHETYIRDIQPFKCEGVEVLHITFPYSDDSFSGIVKGYIAEYNPRLTIIHSSTRVGTTDECGPHVVHSPERGRHPNLAKEMLAFPKFIGGRDNRDLDVAAAYFAACGWVTLLFHNPCETELFKLVSNVHLGLEIAWRQEVERMLKAFGVSDDFGYRAWEESYNAGHLQLGQSQLIRPTLKADPIGGHCILPCTDILANQFSSDAFDFIRGSNAKREEEVRKAADRADSNSGHREAARA